MRFFNTAARRVMAHTLACTGAVPVSIQRPPCFSQANPRYVDAVVEVDVIRQSVDAGPAQRLALGEALPHRRQDLRVGPDLRMAGHAGMGGRNAGVLRDLDRRMAVTAIEAEAADVVLMAKRHRLRRDVSFLRIVTHHRHDPDEDQKKRDDTCSPRAG